MLESKQTVEKYFSELNNKICKSYDHFTMCDIDHFDSCDGCKYLKICIRINGVFKELGLLHNEVKKLYD